MTARQIIGTLLVAVIAALLVGLVLAGPWPLITFLIVCLLGFFGPLRI